MLSYHQTQIASNQLLYRQELEKKSEYGDHVHVYMYVLLNVDSFLYLYFYLGKCFLQLLGCSISKT